MELKGLNILVVDDNKIHLEAAVAQLKDGNNIKVVSDFDEGMRLLEGDYDENFKRVPHGFEMVLVDLLIPAGQHCMGPKGEKYVGQEMPIGIFLALVAAKNGAKYVGILSDMDHHDHPASACLDGLKEIMAIGRAKFVASNCGSSFFRRDDFTNPVGYWDAHHDSKTLKDGFVEAKDWLNLARVLLEE